MLDLNIPGSASTPAIISNSADGSLVMRGDSYPENSFEMFDPVIRWVEQHLEATGALKLELELLYLNTSSIKAMMDIFDVLETAHGRGHQVLVNWYFDQGNERVAELAEEFREDCTFPFHVIGRP
jgi:hypothetical protein